MVSYVAVRAYDCNFMGTEKFRGIGKKNYLLIKNW